MPARIADSLDTSVPYLDRERACVERILATAGPDDTIYIPNFQSPVPRGERRARLINTVHDTQFLYAPRFFTAPQFAALVGQFQLTRDNADGIVFISETSRAEFNGFYGAAPADWIIPPVITAKSRNPAAIDKRENFLLAVAHQEFHPHKNFGGLIALFASLAARDPALRLVMTGHGKDKVLARLPPLPPDIRARLNHAGYVSRAALDDLFDRAWAHISLSFFEGFNMPAAEGAIRGTPLILSDIPVHRELFGDRALLVDPASPSVEAISAFLAQAPRPQPAWPHAARCAPAAVGAAMADMLAAPATLATGVSQKPGRPQPTILFAEELGGGLGHVVKLIAVARQFPEARRIFALRDPALTAPAVARALGPDVLCLQAPDFPGRQPDPIPERDFADILRNCGFADVNALALPVGRWRVLVDGCRPDLVVSDFAPSVRIAVADYRPHIAVGNGFTIVPDMAPFPPFRAMDEDRGQSGSEAAVLAAANAVRAYVGLPPLPRAASLLSGDRTFCASLAALDPFAGRRTVPLLTPLETSGVPAGPPVAERRGPHIFCYFDADHVAVNPLLSALNRLGESAQVYVRGIDPSRLAVHCAPHIGIHARPADFAMVLPQTRLVIHAGTIGTATAALMAGTPQLVIPDTLERELGAEAVVRAGVAARMMVAADADPEPVCAAIDRVLKEPGLAARAQEMAPAVHAALRQDAPEVIIAAAARELMGLRSDATR